MPTTSWFASAPATLEARIRGLSAPPTDRIWQRHRAEADVLEKLGQRDVQLVGLAQEVAVTAAKLDPEAWNQPERLMSLTGNIGKVGAGHRRTDGVSFVLTRA